MSSCVFCKIIAREVPSEIVFEDDDAVAFLDTKPLFLGHVLVVPRVHVVTLPELADGAVGPFFTRVRAIAKAVPIAMEVEGTFVAANNIVSQSVPHLHFHVVPRKKGDGLKGFFWPRVKYASDAAMKETGEKIRATLLGMLVVVASLAIFGCSKTKSEEPSQMTAGEPAPAASSTASGAVATNAGPTIKAMTWSAKYSRPAPARLVAIGDLHGDLDATRAALRLAGALDAKDSWSGGALVVVQTGDEIDRGDGDRAIVDMFDRLKIEAKTAGGEVIALVGNHEIMNASLDFRYVTAGGFSAFDPNPSAANDPRFAALDSSARARAAAFSPGGVYATKLAERPVVVKIGDDVFLHGGVLPKHIRYGLERANDLTREFFLGNQPAPPTVVTQEDGLVWTRMYSAAPSREDCQTLDEALSQMGAKRMVVGHTPQRNGITAACADHVYRIDTGMSKFYSGKIEVLEIKSGVAKILGSF